MAMIKPSLQLSNYGNIIPFDATKDYIFYFSANGSDQITKNQITIYDSSDNSIAFDETILSFSLQHLLPANKLINGKSYIVKIRAGNNSNVWSSYSDLIPFKCLSTPVISISNVVNETINNQTFNFQGTYSQSQNEQLQSYRFLLYDSNQTLIASSLEILYSQDNSLSHEFSGMENNEKYYIEFIITTVNNIQVSTEKIVFTVSYITPRFNVSLTLENIQDKGAVQLYAEVIQIIGYSSGIMNFIDNEEVDLSKGMIYWQDNFSIDNNFTMKIWLRDIIKDVPIGNLYGLQGKIQLIYNGNQINCYSTINNITTRVPSNSITINSENDVVFIFLQKNNEYLSIQAQVN
jgi:hypothetical protein